MKKNTAAVLDRENTAVNLAKYTAFVAGTERPDIDIKRHVDPNTGAVTILTTSRLAADGSLPVPLPTMDGLVRNIDPTAKVVRSVKGKHLWLRNYTTTKN